MSLDIIGTKALLRALPISRPSHREIILWKLRASPVLVTHDSIIDALWGDDEDGGPYKAKIWISVVINQLRKNGIIIKTHWGRGYALRPVAK